MIYVNARNVHLFLNILWSLALMLQEVYKKFKKLVRAENFRMGYP